MKRFAAALIALALLLGAGALAFQGNGYPPWDGSTLSNDSLCGMFNSEGITLRFDPATDYSNLEGGIVQACFYAYDASETHYLELYLLMPRLVRPGDMLRSGEDAHCSICLYETAMDGEDFYYAGDVDERMAGDTSYELCIESVEGSGTYLRVSGHFTAQLGRFEKDQPTGDRLSIGEAHFDFTLPLSAATAEPGSPTPEPFAPDPTFPVQPDDTEVPGTTFPVLPEETMPPSFPGLPSLTTPPTFPGQPEQTTPPSFPGLPDSPRSGDGGPSFTLPPDYAVI